MLEPKFPQTPLNRGYSPLLWEKAPWFFPGHPIGGISLFGEIFYPLTAIRGWRFKVRGGKDA